MERIDALLRDAVSVDQVPGVAATAFDAKRVRYAGSFGLRGADGSASMTLDTVFGVYSMTKPLVAAVAMQLVEKGLLSLDAPASELCPALADAQVLVAMSKGGPQLRPPSEPISLRHLLTHTSGIVYNVWNQTYAGYFATLDPSEQDQLVNGDVRPILMFDPGSRWEYGTGLEWVKQMVEVSSGQSLDRLLDACLFEPLSMSDTTFFPGASARARMGETHQRLSDGSITAVELPERPQIARGSGGLFSTVGDYGQFCRMLLNNGNLDGERILAPATVDLLCSNAIGANRVVPLKTVMPQFSNDADFFPGEPKSWSLCGQLNESSCHTGRRAGTLMWAGLANTYFWVDRAAGIGGVFATQIFPFADQVTLALNLDFEAEVYRELEHRPVGHQY